MEPTRLFDLIEKQNEKFAKPDSLANKVDGTWVKYSTPEVIEIANKVSFGLLKLGITKGDKVAIISPNRPEWNFIDFGIQQIGAVSVPMYPTITVDDYKFIFNDAEVKMVFVADQEIFNKVKVASENAPSIKGIYSFNELKGVKHWSEVKELGKEGSLKELEAMKSQVNQDDLFTLIYTSGTTGSPKGVMLTHRNILSNVQSCSPLMPVDSTNRALSFLPLCHIYERMLNYMYMNCGVSVYYAESMETIGENLKEIHPQIFVTVPRLLEKVYDKIYAKGTELKGLKKRLFFWALNLGLRYETNIDQGWWYNFQLNLANKIIFNKWREALGGEVKAVVSGSAPLQPRLAKVFWAARIRVMEGYGLTETSPVISVNRFEPKDNMIGTVGFPITGIEVKLAEDGEILTRGPHVMKGYYNRPDLTEQTIDKEGWLHTGDIGEFVEGRFLKITDRKKEMFKTSGGKYVAPQVIENKFKESRIIEQLMVVGEGQKFPAALIIPSFLGLKTWCDLKGIPYSTDEEMIRKPEIIEKFKKEVEQLNENFAQFERIKKFELLSQLWTIESGELTPTLKLKRKIILANNKDLIEKMYA